MTTWTEKATKQAIEIWKDYQRNHDVSIHTGKVVGIVPLTGEVWFGESAKDIANQMEQAGKRSEFYCVRVGHDYYFRKSGRR
jgi:hypothetical protein